MPEPFTYQATAIHDCLVALGVAAGATAEVSVTLEAEALPGPASA